ncbi:ABC transporter permease [Dongia sedimenti]|uniref:ABC transporter permease subunit n=1 Tax=Dongia sedimenti TaxID=3064282 RepID=A0ABU0YI72_9PROT|nr:ABC transporter permease subunit [Rhodospirillaceae bacterium R-7]
MSRRGHRAQIVVVGLFVVLQVLPVLAVALNAFAGEWAGTVLPEELTWRWAAQIFADPRFIEALRNSLLISFGAMTVSALVTIPAVLAGHCYLPSLDRWLGALVILPYAVPGIALALGLMRIYSGQYGVQLNGTPWVLIFGYVPLGASFYYLPIKNNLRAVPVQEIIEAGHLVGAGDLAIMRRVILPAVMRGVVVGLVMNFALAISEFVYANLLVGGFYPTLQIFMNVLRQGSGHLTSVVVTVYFVVVWILSTAVVAVMAKREA